MKLAIYDAIYPDTLNSLVHSALRCDLRLCLRFSLSAGDIDAAYLFRVFAGVFEAFPQARITVLGTPRTCEAMLFCWQYFDRTLGHARWQKTEETYQRRIAFFDQYWAWTRVDTLKAAK